MRRRDAGDRSRASGEDGFTLVELLVAAMMSTIVVGAGVLMITSVLHGQPRQSARAHNIQTARVFLDSINRDLRQGTAISTYTASTLRLSTYVPVTNAASACGSPHSGSTVTKLCQVTYTCASTSCTRTVREANGSGSSAAVRVIDGLSSPSLFSYVPSSGTPGYVGIKVVMPGSQPGEDAITLEDGVDLRNSTV